MPMNVPTPPWASAPTPHGAMPPAVTAPNASMAATYDIAEMEPPVYQITPYGLVPVIIPELPMARVMVRQLITDQPLTDSMPACVSQIIILLQILVTV
jgi:hypothetical protein